MCRLRVLGALVCLAFLVALVPALPLPALGVLWLLPPFGNRLGLIGAHSVPPVVRAMMAISPQYVLTPIISYL